MFEPGEKVGDVEIIARLKAGGMAALYLGRRVGAGGFSKDVAVKVIHTHLAEDQSFVEMFVDEARLSARIDHPNVVRVEALREHRGAYCLLMEFVHGCALSQLMAAIKKRGMRFSPELAVAVAIRVADGLHAAHDLLNPDGTPAGVVHRDVSPANVLVGYRGEVKLIDFGIAKATQRLHQTDAAGLKGKIAYMAPEQAFGRDVDRRTDVYALGIVLWEMLTMRRLFAAENDLRLLDMVRDPKVVPVSALVPDTPPALDRTVLEALAVDRDRRPASARELRYRLLDALPAAAAVDPLQVSAVVCEVMSDKILEEREVFSLSSFNTLPQPSERESVTLSRLLRPVSVVREVPDDAGQSAQELAEGLQHVRTVARAGAAHAPAAAGGAPSAARADPARRRGRAGAARGHHVRRSLSDTGRRGRRADRGGHAAERGAGGGSGPARPRPDRDAARCQRTDRPGRREARRLRGLPRAGLPRGRRDACGRGGAPAPEEGSVEPGATAGSGRTRVRRGPRGRRGPAARGARAGSAAGLASAAAAADRSPGITRQEI
ncbi:MAG: serine/threonine protein kinase [Sandaracinaceae bacterium]|nr:serine/threonine protein kinase [Sandaracinaceae bacterium]